MFRGAWELFLEGDKRGVLGPICRYGVQDRNRVFGGGSVVLNVSTKGSESYARIVAFLLRAVEL